MQLKAALVLIIFTTGCLSFGWVSIADVKAPRQNARVSVMKRCIGPDCIVRISLTKDRSKLLLFDDRRDRLPRGAIVRWAGDSSTVAVHVCDSLGGNITLGYDLNHNRSETKESVTRILRDLITTQYHPDGDPLAWACSEEGIAALNKG